MTESPVDIPQVTGIKIDGNGDDWADRGLHLDALAPADGNLPNQVDNISARLGWDERGLLVYLTMHQAAKDHDHSVELFLSRGDTIDRFRVLISGDAAGMKATATDNRQMMVDRAKPIEMTVQSSITPHGYAVEAVLPWKNLNAQPAIGLQMRTQIRVNVTDADGTKTQYRWHFGSNNYVQSMLIIRLAKEPSAPIELAAEGRYERLQRIRIGVIGASELAGKTVDVLDGDRVIASGTLAANGIASSVVPIAALVVPMPPRGHSYGKLTVRAGNDAQVNLNLQDRQSAQGRTLTAELVRSKALDEDPVLFKPFVFSGDKFPACEFQDPVTADECIGPYSLRTTFYDVNLNQVTSPTAPGRYGAVVEVRSEESGKTFKRFCTLFKTAGKADWSGLKLPDGLQLPGWLGLSSGVIEHQSKEIHFQLDHALDESMLRDPETAVSVAGLFETAADAPAWLERQDATERDRQWWYQLRKKIGEDVALKYLAYMPKGYDSDPAKKWPLILSLHGAGERGDDLNVLKVYGIPMICEQGKDDSYIAICPQCPVNESWLAMQLNDLLDEVCKKYRADPDRIYVTGASMGGVGTWSLVQQYPDRIAAIVPVCGHGDTNDVDRIKNLPVWIFHGEDDPVVPVAKERAMAEALAKEGNQVRMTVYPGVGHECWNQAWATPELIPWMLEQKRGISAGAANHN